jgi:hypothetical protein
MVLSPQKCLDKCSCYRSTSDKAETLNSSSQKNEIGQSREEVNSPCQVEPSLMFDLPLRSAFDGLCLCLVLTSRKTMITCLAYRYCTSVASNDLRWYDPKGSPNCEALLSCFWRRGEHHMMVAVPLCFSELALALHIPETARTFSSRAHDTTVAACLESTASSWKIEVGHKGISFSHVPCGVASARQPPAAVKSLPRSNLGRAGVMPSCSTAAAEAR